MVYLLKDIFSISRLISLCGWVSNRLNFFIVNYKTLQLNRYSVIMVM
nr:MAG TPA: hypothetical protein [Caudoviricetes sp.]